MIKVVRSPKPAILAKHEAQWLDKYQQAIAQNLLHPSPANKEALNKAERKYNHKQIKTELEKMFSGKCAYCESHIRHVGYGAIEHFNPKSKFPDLCFSWENLLLACDQCNDKGHKGDKFPDASNGGPYVNPTKEDPDDFFEFEFDPDTGTANVIPKNQRGLITETDLGLNRANLLKHRSSIVRKMVCIAIKASLGDTDCGAEILQYCGNEDEYSAFARALVKKFNL